jgi:glucuronate isomerase
MARRLDCAYLAELVVRHRLSEDEAARIAHDLVAVNPRRTFKL